MEIIVEWIKTIAITSIVGAVVYFLVPKGNLEKALRLVVSFSLILSILYPFLNGVIKTEFDFSEFLSIEEIEMQADDKAEEYAKIYNDALSAESISIVKESIKKLLDSSKFKYSDIEISTDITQDNGIVINKIKIVVSGIESEQNMSYVRESIKELTGIYPEFEVADGV